MVSSDERDPRRDNDAIEVTRSEEQLQVLFDRVPYRRVRLVKHIISEEVTRTVQVRREELRVEPEDVFDAQPIERWAARPTLDEPLELTLSEEQVVIESRVVPRERIRVWVEDVEIGDHLVESTLRQERIDIVDPTLRDERASVDRPNYGDRPLRDRLPDEDRTERPIY